MSVDQQLMAITPLDGRYAERMGELAPLVSEYGLINYRAEVETAWLGMLGTGVLPGVEPLSDQEQAVLDGFATGFSMDDALKVKEIEKEKNHDVKAVEIWLAEKMAASGVDFREYQQLVHLGCTSEDITNLAYAFMLSDVRSKILVPQLDRIADTLAGKAEEYAEIPLLARTHGQPAIPTTLGKEMGVFADRVDDSSRHLAAVAILGKFNGASGNYNALTFAYSEVDWPAVSRRFVEERLDLAFNPRTTQIEPHDWTARYANEVALGNTILTDVARDMWLYISNKVFTQKVVKGEVGSSTMPHKVNPIDFENAEANFGLANATLNFLAGKLPISRLQRDLSDSSAQRAFGTAFGHTVVAYTSLEKGLGKVKPNAEHIAQELDSDWSILTEAVQTLMRRHGVEGAYDQMKAASRGRALDRNDYLELVEQLDLPEDAKQRLRQLTPAAYLGKAPDLAQHN